MSAATAVAAGDDRSADGAGNSAASWVSRRQGWAAGATDVGDVGNVWAPGDALTSLGCQCQPATLAPAGVAGLLLGLCEPTGRTVLCDPGTALPCRPPCSRTEESPVSNSGCFAEPWYYISHRFTVNVDPESVFHTYQPFQQSY